MKRKDALPELLSPAGDFQALIAAVKAGADAIYVGGKSFSARAFAKNFDMDELSRAVRYCHLHSVKLYVTVNTLVYDRELEELKDYAVKLYNIGVDAVIIADMGALSVISSAAPKLPLHASTQMSVHSLSGAEAASRVGAERVVLARELNRDDIRSITEKATAETEVFLHGALCVCHSGQCLFSSMVGGRSGNRGECAQPCRLPYGNGYPLSLSDLSLADHIPELIDMGVASLKIEGRMKSPDYVFSVTEIYRRLLDERRKATPAERSVLERVFSRTGFTDGYFTGKLDKMTGVRSADDKKNTRELEKREFCPDRVTVSAKVRIVRDYPSEMTLTLGGVSVTVFGEKPSEAINAPLTEDSVKARLCKMGNTFLSLSEKDVSLELSCGVNLSPAAINALRREAAEKLEYRFAVRDREPITEAALSASSSIGSEGGNTALFLNGEVARAVCQRGGFRNFRLAFIPLWQLDGIEPADNLGVYLPPVVTDGEYGEVHALLTQAANKGFKYALVGNIGQISMAKALGFRVFGDFRLNVTNGKSAEAFRRMGVEDIILSPEITLPMARDVGGGVICYGRIPLMLLERCYMKEGFGCNSCGKCGLKDRTGVGFPLMREYSHRNLLLNSAVTYMGDKRGELDSYRIKWKHFIFTTESADEVMKVTSAFNKGAPFPLGGSVRRIGKR